MSDATVPVESASTAHLTEKPSFLERKLPKGRPDVIPSLPFHSLSRASFSTVENVTLQLPLVVTMAELSNKANMEEMVRRLVLFRNPDAIEQKAGAKRSRTDDSDDSDNSDNEGCSVAQPKAVSSRAVVRIAKIGVPQSHVQIKGMGGASSVKFNLPVDVVIATVGHGICPGIVREVGPYPGVANIEIECDSERVLVTCICPEAEPAVVGQTVLVAAEPACLRVQVFRPPRVSRGTFEKKTDVKLGQTELVFVPDFSGDAKAREAAESKNAEAAVTASA